MCKNKSQQLQLLLIYTPGFLMCWIYFVDCRYNHLLLLLVCSDIFVLTVMHLILYWEEGMSTSALHHTIV